MHSKQALEQFPSEMEENYNLRTAYIIQPTHFSFQTYVTYVKMYGKAGESTEMLLEYYYIGGETINRSYPIFDGLGWFQNDAKNALSDCLKSGLSETI